MFKRLIAWGIRAYQLAAHCAGWRVCRFYPTCSHYALDAVEQKGVLKGFGLAIWRILRCHPLCKGGYDPVR